MSQVTLEEALRMALGHHQAGRLQEAEAIYRQILAAEPRQPDALHLLGMIAGEVGQRDAAVGLIRQAIAIVPDNAVYHCNLGLILQDQPDEAIACYQRALALKPDYPEALNNLGDVLMRKGQFDQASECFQRAVALKPDFAEAHYNLGNSFNETGQIDQAIACYERTIAIRPGFADAHNNLGSAFKARGQLDQAIAAYRRALELRPGYAEVHLNLGNALVEGGQIGQAIVCYRQALTLKPDYPEAHYNMGNVLKDEGQLDQAVACWRRAVELNPDYPEALNNLGNALRDRNQSDQAITYLRRALVLKPDYPEACYNLGNALKDGDQLDQAIASYRKALELKPNYADAHNNLGSPLKDTGDLDAAINSYRRAIELDPRLVGAHSNLLFALHYHPSSTPQSLLAEAQQWNRQHAQPLQRFIRPHRNDRNPDRQLRIGYVSPDLCGHVVGHFLLPLLANHDRQAFRVFGYAQVPAPDAMTATLQAHTDAWRSLVGVSDEHAAEMIRQDQIDILVDLAMHTANNRLLVLARKPAPVQVSYLAYAGGTGLDAIGYRLTDRYLDPDEADDRYYMEKSLRLAGTYWCYQQSTVTPPANEPPALSGGKITFGCLNNFCKVSENVLETWAGLLRALPDAQLLLHTLAGGHRDRVERFLEDRGIAPERLELVGRLSPEEYFQTYLQIDIALDPFPYGGGTTTCDALWMGVPVVTLAGRTAVGRAGVSILSNAGLPELIAQSPEQYVQIATALANDLPRLAELRSTLRQRLQASPLMDAKGYACGIEQAYRSMWRNWCGC